MSYPRTPTLTSGAVLAVIRPASGQPAPSAAVVVAGYVDTHYLYDLRAPSAWRHLLDASATRPIPTVDLPHAARTKASP